MMNDVVLLMHVLLHVLLVIIIKMVLVPNVIHLNVVFKILVKIGMWFVKQDREEFFQLLHVLIVILVNVVNQYVVKPYVDLDIISSMDHVVHHHVLNVVPIHAQPMMLLAVQKIHVLEFNVLRTCKNFLIHHHVDNGLVV